MPDPFSRERLLSSWTLYRRKKRRLAAVQAFDLRREEEIERLHRELHDGSYRHGAYRTFVVHDPKRRTITAAGLRDRIVHQAVTDELTRVFEPVFLDCSYSARATRGVHLAVDRAERSIARLRSAGAWPIWAWKGDVRKFYDSVDHALLLRLIGRRVRDPRFLDVVRALVASHHSQFGPGKGIPIGNLSSQIFANIYLHELDRFAKHELRLRHYLRYADDFLLFGADCGEVATAFSRLVAFLRDELLLDLSPVSVSDRWPRKLSQGVDFLGTVLWPYGRTLRPATRGRIIRRVEATTEGYVLLNMASYRAIAKRVRDKVQKDALGKGWVPKLREDEDYWVGGADS